MSSARLKVFADVVPVAEAEVRAVLRTIPGDGPAADRRAIEWRYPSDFSICGDVRSVG